MLNHASLQEQDPDHLIFTGLARIIKSELYMQ